VLLQLEALELQSHLVVIWSCYAPHALLVGHVVQRIIGRVYRLIPGQLDVSTTDHCEGKVNMAN